MNTKNTKMRFASVAMILAMAVMGITTQMMADDGLRLSARQNKIVNGFQAELRGDYREKNGNADRLNAELEKINLPVGTPVAFCLNQHGVRTLIGVGTVIKVAGVPSAEIELEANDGNPVPKVSVGDSLESRQKTTAPFLPNPTCTSAPLLAAPFKK